MNFRCRALSRSCWIALFCAYTFLAGSIKIDAQVVTANVTQQLVFAGLRSAAAKGQVNAVATDAAGDIYLAFDQGDGVRVLEVANDGGALLAEVHLGAAGDSAVALVVDPNGSIYIAGTSRSGSLVATSGAAIATVNAGTTNSFVAKFDTSLNPVFLTFTGGTRIAASALAASADSVFVTGILYASDLPVSFTAIQQTPAFGSIQNGFIEAFSADGASLEYATYVTGALGDTTPTGIAVDAGDDVWVVGSTTATGFPTIAAVVPQMLSSPSGFLLQLTPAGDGIVYSTFVPGSGLSSVALDSTGLNLLISGQVALGQFPVDTVESPLVPTYYQVLLRMSLDGSKVQNGTVIAPGVESVVTAAGGGAAWIGGSFTPGAAPLLPQSALSSIGNSYAVRVTPGAGIDQTVRFGGLASFDETYASVPVEINGIAVDGAGALFAGGSAQPTASSSLLSTETYDFPLRGGPTAALPSAIANAEAAGVTCGGSLCSGSGGYLVKVDPTRAGPSLAFSADSEPYVTLRNLGSSDAEGLQISTSAGALTTNCVNDLAPGGECDVLLSGGSAGMLSVSTGNGGGSSVAFAAYAAAAAGGSLAFVPKELDFGIRTAANGPTLRTVTISNLGETPTTFSEGIEGSPEFSTPFSEVSSTCPLAGGSTKKLLSAGASCTVLVGFSALNGSANDNFVQADWPIGSGELLLTGYSQSASLSISASELDFGTQFEGGLALPRYLFLSNASGSQQTHAAVSIPANAPFTVSDACPSSLPPGTVCRLRFDYLSSVVPSADSLTVVVDAGLSVLLTGQTMPPQTVSGSTLTSSLTVSPTTATFGNAVVVTAVSSVTQTVSLTNSGTTSVPLSIVVSGDFSDVTSCGTSLPAGANCAVALAFTPSTPGVRQGLLTVSSGPGMAPVIVALSGTATGLLAANNGTLAAGQAMVGQPVVQFYKVTQTFDSLNLATTGPYLVTLVEDEGFGYGTPPSSAYGARGSGTCHNCWVGVRFLPAGAGEQNGTLTFSSDPNGLPYMLQLSGTGVATSGLIISPATLDFGTVPVNSVSGSGLSTLTNLASTGSSITISGVTASGDFSIVAPNGAASACAGTLAYAATCSVSVQFAPSATGQRSGSLIISTSAGTATTPLTGTGTMGSGIAVSPLSLTFPSVPGEALQIEAVSVQNNGSQPVSVGTPTTNTTNFTETTGCGALAPGASCSIDVSFAPGAIPVSDVLSILITSAGSGGTQQTQTFQVSLSGNSTVQNQGLTVSPATAQFGPVATTTLSSARQIMVTNLADNQVVIAVAMPRNYELQQNACTTLAANASCVLTVVFIPLENGDLPGTISVTATASDGSSTQTSLIYADGFGVGTGALTLTGGLIVNGVFNFGAVASGLSASQQFTLTNAGTQAVTVRRVASQPPFASSTTCGSSLISGGSCVVTVQYSPVASGFGSPTGSLSGSDSGTLTVESDAQTSPTTLNLAGEPTTGAGAGVSPLASYSLSEGTLSFAATTVGDISAAQNLLLTNTGSSALQVSSVSASADFSVQNQCGLVLAGGSCTIAVASSPQGPGNRIAGLQIASNAPDSLEYVTLVGIGASSPLVLSPGSLTFGQILVGAEATLPLQVTNSGSSSITFTSITHSGSFDVVGTCPLGGVLAAQASCTEQVFFTPVAAGPANGMIGFVTSASTVPIAVPVSGSGVQAELIATPSALSFGSIPLGDTGKLTLTLTNRGNIPVSGLSIAVTGDYAVVVPCATNLAGGASCRVQVTLTPTLVGARPGTLTIVSSDPGSPLTLALVGAGAPGASFTLTVNGGSSATQTVRSGDFATLALLVEPSGGFTGNVALTCTPAQSVSYASCSLLPSQLNFGISAQASTATINTEQSKTSIGVVKAIRSGWSGQWTLAFLLPGALMLFRRDRSWRRRIGRGLALGAMLFVLQLSGCGGGTVTAGTGNGENNTPPGEYQFQVTASSTSGAALTHTVSLTLVVTSR